MTAEQIKKVMREHRIFQWEVAKKLGIAEFTLCRWLREDLTTEQEERIKKAINSFYDDPII